MSSNRENSTLGARKKADVQIDTGRRRTNIKAADSNGIVGGKKVKNSLESPDISPLTLFAEIICFLYKSSLPTKDAWPNEY